MFGLQVEIVQKYIAHDELYVTIAIDWRGFGERSEGNIFDGRDPCNINFIKGAIIGYNLLTMDIFDGMRCIDYLCALDFVDSRNIGCMGLSFGGTMTAWLTIMEPRIKAADIICYSARFSKFAMKNNNFCVHRCFLGCITFVMFPICMDSLLLARYCLK